MLTYSVAELTPGANAKISAPAVWRPHSARGSHDRGSWVTDRTPTACPVDNAAREGFFGRLKTELLYPRDRRGATVEQFIKEVDSYTTRLQFVPQQSYDQAQYMPGAKVLVQFVAAEVGGRTMPAYLTREYRPHFRVGSGEYLGVVFSGDESSRPIQPGICTDTEVAFIYAPNVDYGDLVVGSQFEILEGARIVGVGVVSELVP